jgi:hypothetical protein
MPSYSLVRPYPQDPNGPEEPPTYAIVADTAEAHYVFPTDSTFMGLDDARLARLVKVTKQTPTTEMEWLSLAGSNIGYYYLSEPVAAATLADAIIQAKAVLAQTQTV